MCDPLVKMDLDLWPELQRVFKADWPRSVSGYYLLESQKDWRDRGLDYGFTVYCPFGNVVNGMVAVNNKKELYEVILLCPQDDTSVLEDALVNSCAVDWSRRAVVPFAPNNVVRCMARVLPRLGARFETTLTSDSFLLAKGRSPFPISVPPNVYVDKLRQEHVDQVDSSWPHRYPTSPWYFSSIISAGGGYGVFLKRDHCLVSWLFVNEAGTLGNLYTAKEHRKKGLAELILKHVSNELLNEGKDVFAFCVKGNVQAYSLYNKMGFEKFSDVTWCYIKPESD